MYFEEGRNINGSVDGPTRAIVIPRDEELRDEAKLTGLALDLYLLGLPRRDVPDWIAENLSAFEGCIFYHDGRPFVTHDETVDEAFSNEGTFRWISDFVKLRLRKPRQKPQNRVLPRLQLIAASLQIEEIAPRVPFKGELVPEAIDLRRRDFAEVMQKDGVVHVDDSQVIERTECSIDYADLALEELRIIVGLERSIFATFWSSARNIFRAFIS